MPRAGVRWSATLSAEIGKAVLGQLPIIERLQIALLTGGHVLLEGMPGLAKTLLVKSLAQAMGAAFERIQFTPDLLPSDVVGTMVFSPADGHRHGIRTASHQTRPALSSAGGRGCSDLQGSGRTVRTVWNDRSGQEWGCHPVVEVSRRGRSSARFGWVRCPMPVKRCRPKAQRMARAAFRRRRVRRPGDPFSATEARRDR
jgi:hypothetical protein